MLSCLTPYCPAWLTDIAVCASVHTSLPNMRCTRRVSGEPSTSPLQEELWAGPEARLTFSELVDPQRELAQFQQQGEYRQHPPAAQQQLQHQRLPVQLPDEQADHSRNINLQQQHAQSTGHTMQNPQIGTLSLDSGALTRWMSDPDSPALAGSPSAVDALMREFGGGPAWTPTGPL